MYNLREDSLPKMVSESPYSTDEQLAEQVREGDRSAFAQLVERHTDRFYRTAYRMLKNKGDAEDMTQTAFLKFWQQPQKWDPDKNVKFTTWFYRVVINLCLDHLKKQKPDSLPEDKFAADPEAIPEEALLKAKKQQVLEQFLKELPERQRTALNLCFYEGLSNQEAAEVMGIKLKALQSLLMRGKESLREKVRHLDKGGVS